MSYGSPFLQQGNNNYYPQAAGAGGIFMHPSSSPHQGLQIPMVQMSTYPGYHAPATTFTPINNTTTNNFQNQYPHASGYNSKVPDLELLLGNDMSNHNNGSVLRPSAVPAATGFPSGSQYTGASPQHSNNNTMQHYPIATNSAANPFNNNTFSHASPTIQQRPPLSSTFSSTTTSAGTSNKKQTNSSNIAVDAEFPGKGEPNERYSSMVYLKDELHMKESDILRARNEHVDPEPDLCLEPEQLRDYAGTAIFVYFRFLKFIGMIVAIQFILTLINYIIFAAAQSPSFKSETSSATNSTKFWYSDFFITNYTQNQRVAWSVTTIIGLVIIVIGLICYRQIWIGWFRYEDDSRTLAEMEAEKASHRDLTGLSDETIIRYTSDGKISVANHYRSAVNFGVRRFSSFMIFVGFVCAQVFSSIAITKSSQNSQSLGVSFAIAFIAAILNMAFTNIARRLTEFEKYHHMESADRSLVVKLVCFKIANLMAVYGAKSYGNSSCVYDIIGEQFMTLLLVEIFFVTPSTIAIAGLTTHFSQTYSKFTGGILGDDNYSARFELPVEYLAALYKFCLSSMAMVVFPLSTVLAVIAFFVEFWAARYRLIKICGKPERSEANHRNTVVFITLLIFVAVILTPFAGAAFVLSGRSMLETNTTIYCHGFPKVP